MYTNSVHSAHVHVQELEHVARSVYVGIFVLYCEHDYCFHPSYNIKYSLSIPEIKCSGFA